MATAKPGRTSNGLSAARGVPLGARVGGGLQRAVGLPAGGAHAAELPRPHDLDLVPPLPQLRGDVEAALDGDVPRPGLARVERRRERLRVELRRVDRLLQVPPEAGVAEQDVELPLVLLVAPRRAEREIRLAPAQDERRRERRPRPPPGT